LQRRRHIFPADFSVRIENHHRGIRYRFSTYVCDDPFDASMDLLD
jgi:hypothetical protein